MNTALGYKNLVLPALILTLAACSASDSAQDSTSNQADDIIIGDDTVTEDPGASQEPIVLGPMVPMETPVSDVQHEENGHAS